MGGGVEAVSGRDWPNGRWHSQMLSSLPLFNSSLYRDLASVPPIPLTLLLPNASTVSYYQNQRFLKKKKIFVFILNSEHHSTYLTSTSKKYSALMVYISSVFYLPYDHTVNTTFDGSSTSTWSLNVEGFRYNSEVLFLACSTLSNLSSLLGF